MRGSAFFFVVAVGCAAGPRPSGTTMPEPALPESTAPPEMVGSPAAPPGAIARAELNRVLDAAPGRFLAHVETEPRFVGGRFRGWRLVSFFPGDARFAGLDLRAGDVVTRVNGSSVERPEQLMQVWDSLRSADELVVDLERNGVPRQLRWPIEPSARPGPPRAPETP
jgi:S1-C subfamily serine protease